MTNSGAPCRLTDYLARAGFGGRREAQRLIAAGRVKVNGQVVTQARLEVTPGGDHVRVDDKLIKKLWPLTYLLFNKPERTISATRDPGERRTVYEYLGKYANVVQSVGRLDWDTEGALLFTNDGEMAHALASPEFKVAKTYRLKIKGRVLPPELERLRRGVDIGGYVTAAAQVRELSSGPANMWLQITLVEGKYRQIKRMLEAVGHRVVRLLRERFGPLELSGLRPGEWRHLTDAEVRALRDLVRAE